MAKAATSGQARSFNAALTVRLDEKALEQIDGEKIQKAIDNTDGLIHNIIRFINNDCRFLSGPLIVHLDEEPRPWEGRQPELNTRYEFEPVFDPEKIMLVKKHKDGAMLSAIEYNNRLLSDRDLLPLNAKIIEFCEDYQYDPEVAKFLEPYKGSKLFQFGTLYPGNGSWFTYLWWNRKSWVTKDARYDNNWILSGYAFAMKRI